MIKENNERGSCHNSTVEAEEIRRKVEVRQACHRSGGCEIRCRVSSERRKV